MAEPTPESLSDAELRAELVRAREQNQALAARVRVLEEAATEQARLDAELKESEGRFRALISGLQVGVVVQGTGAEILLCNAKALELLGLTEEEYLGRTSFDPRWNITDASGAPFPAEQRPVAQVLRTRRSVRDVVIGVSRPRTQDRVWLLINAVPQLDDGGAVTQVVSTFTDLTELRRAEDRARQLATEIALLSTPCIPIGEGVVVLPLIGTLDAARAAQAEQTLLAVIAERAVRVALLDLTGLAAADAGTAPALQRIAGAVRLLGARLIVTGVRAALAAELVRAGCDLDGVPTYSSLQQGVAVALRGAGRG
ncbi:MAG: PAS domain-containing protein [Polyangia bacterium]